jgi:replicative DNA helicase
MNAYDEIIGAVLREPSLYEKVRFLSPSDFVQEDHIQIWGAIRESVAEGHDPTPERITASTFLDDQDLPRRLIHRATANVDALIRQARLISDERSRGRAITLTREALKKLEDRSNPQWRDVTKSLSDNLVSETPTGRSMTANEVQKQLLRRLDRQVSTRIPTGLRALDARLGGGLHPGTLTMLGAFGKTGKTTLCATISYNMEAANTPHLMACLERGGTEVEELKTARRLGCKGFDLGKYKDKIAALAPTKRCCHYVHDTAMTVDDLRHEILYHRRRHGIAAALIDFWQLIQGKEKGESLDAHLTKVAQRLQATSVDADIPIFMTSQLNDNGRSRDSAAALTASNLFLILHRDKDASEAWMETIVSNITDELDIGSIGSPQFILDREAGPHFRDITTL